MKILYRLGHTFYRVLFGLSGGIRIHGAEHIPQSGGFLICANHRSLLDPPAIGTVFKRAIGYLAKKELFAIPMFGKALPRVNAIPVDRDRLGKDTVKAIMHQVKSGVPVVVFPEGTRSRTGKLGEGKAGVGFLTKLVGAPVLPAYIQNTALWPRTWKKSQRMAIFFGKPIESEWIARIPRDKPGYQEIADEIIRRIRTLHKAATGAEYHDSAECTAIRMEPSCAEHS